ncbi:MAG: 4Fe-4S dicluster domain-containing protein [Gordonibacter sp.]|uniref:4Fe-4S dicluster domain-containing protein n=1 Tax=Gordonibacter sp. TaxID=1968902 RepID=UPI002FC830FA
MKVFVVDIDKCVGCRSCQLVCKDEHCDNDWMPYAAPQPDTGQFWMNVQEQERGQSPKVCVTYTPVLCQHCADAPCMAVAKDGAVYRREDGLVVVDPVKSKGQEQIVKACPYHAVFWNEELQIPQKCTGCAHLLDDGWTVPRCVEACAHDALRFGELDDFAGELNAAECLLPEAGTNPHVYYLNLPKRFIGGEVADLEAEEVLIGARVVLTNLASGETLETTTDDFGDFWFKQIPAAEYSIDVEMDGYRTRHVTDFISTVERDLNVGTIALYRA